MVSLAEVRGAKVDCVVEDISVGGALIKLDVDIRPDERIAIDVAGVGRIDARVVHISRVGVHVSFPDISDDQVNRILDLLQAAYGP